MVEVEACHCNCLQIKQWWIHPIKRLSWSTTPSGQFAVSLCTNHCVYPRTWWMNRTNRQCKLIGQLHVSYFGRIREYICAVCKDALHIQGIHYARTRKYTLICVDCNCTSQHFNECETRMLYWTGLSLNVTNVYWWTFNWNYLQILCPNDLLIEFKTRRNTSIKFGGTHTHIVNEQVFDESVKCSLSRVMKTNFIESYGKYCHTNSKSFNDAKRLIAILLIDNRCCSRGAELITESVLILWYLNRDWWHTMLP